LERVYCTKSTNSALPDPPSFVARQRLSVIRITPLSWGNAVWVTD